MGAVSTSLFILGLSLAIWGAYTSTKTPIVNENSSCSASASAQRKEKVAIFEVYVQDVKAGPNTTVYDVARSEITSSSATEFGIVRVMDNLLTVGPDYNSEVVGRAQGFVAFTDLHELAVTMSLNFYLTKGEFKGTTLSVLGRQELLTKDREMPILGSAGVFRMARGYVICNNYYESDTYVVLHYKFHVYYSDEEAKDSSSSSSSLDAVA